MTGPRSRSRPASPTSGAGPADRAVLQRRLPRPRRRPGHRTPGRSATARTSTEANPTHTYAAAGNYTAQLTVTDAEGARAVANVPITVGNTAPTVTHRVPARRRLLRLGRPDPLQVTVTDPEDGTIDCASVTVQSFLGHDEHAHPLAASTPAAPASIQTSLASGHGADANVFAVFEATYTDGGGTGGLGPAHRAGIGAAAAQAQAGRVLRARPAGRPTASAAATRACMRETTGDTQGGFQNIGFIEDGDWFSFAPANLTGITSARFRVASASDGGRIEVRTGAVDGPLLGSATVHGHRRLADLRRRHHAGRRQHRHGPALLRRPRPRLGNTGGLFNVNWVDFIGRGVTDNAPPEVTAPRRPRRPAPRRSTVSFTGTATDAEGDTAAHLRRGTSATAARRPRSTPRHIYSAPGTFTATLTVTDAKGAAVLRQRHGPGRPAEHVLLRRCARTTSTGPHWTVPGGRRSSGRTRPTRSAAARCCCRPRSVTSTAAATTRPTSSCSRPARPGRGRPPRKVSLPT